MSTDTRFRLSALMFLQFFMWGAWYGQMSKYLFTGLHATGNQVGNAYVAFSLAMLISPFFVGLIADRYFAAQKVLGVLCLLGAGVLFFLTQTTDPDRFFWLILAYCLTFAPTLALSASIAMRQMATPETQFPGVRVLGTVGWIVVSNLIGTLNLGGTVFIFQLALGTSVLLGVFAFFLPNTPPNPAAPNPTLGQVLGLDAFQLFRDRSFVVFFISSVLICIPLSFYYALANPALTDSGMTFVENKMSLGQVSEVVFMLLIPVAYPRLGIKKMLLVGLLAWIMRFLCFGYGGNVGEWMLFLAILLHGVCYDFFFVTGQIYTDAKAGARIKSSAQGLITLATYGIGMGIGSKLAGLVADYYTLNGVKQWLNIWLVPAAIAAGVLVLFILFFDDKKTVGVAETGLVEEVV